MLASSASAIFTDIVLLQMRDVVRNLAQLFPTAIISGRGREKVENFVQLKELFYAGSHGMDIAGPSVRGLVSKRACPHQQHILQSHVYACALMLYMELMRCTDLLRKLPAKSAMSWMHTWPQAFNGGSWSACVNSTFQPAANFRPLIDSVHKELCARWVVAVAVNFLKRGLVYNGCTLYMSSSVICTTCCHLPTRCIRCPRPCLCCLPRLASIPGSSVEHNTFCVSAHFRNCEGDMWQDVVAAVEQVCVKKDLPLCSVI